MPILSPFVTLRRILPFESDSPVPYVLIWSLALVALAFWAVYWISAGFSGI
jgi:hypothetical protein